MASTTPFEDRVAAVRRFSRFYTRQIGALNEALLASPFSLAQSRVLYELAQRDGLTATELGRDLGLDPAYLSRILKGFEEEGLLGRTPSASDGRLQRLALTAAGRAAFAPLDQASRHHVARMLRDLAEPDQARLVAAMETIEGLVRSAPEGAPFGLRSPRAGDYGTIVARHGALYAAEYGWDETFEGLVAEIVAGFIKSHAPDRERCWIAESEGAVVGSVFLVRQSDTVGKLRLLYVEPHARGLGIGARLVEECIRFARQAGYRTLTLWTNDVLVSARRIYEAAGFRLEGEERHRSFGHDLVGQNWNLAL